MNRRKKLIQNLLILIIIIPLFLNRSGLYISATSAHKASERSIHYGPSNIKHIENLGNRKLFLCEYDQWLSCNTINRTLGVFWSFGDQPVGFKNNLNEAIDFTWQGSHNVYIVYGKINNPAVDYIQLVTKSETITIRTFYDDMFLYVTYHVPDYSFIIHGYNNEDVLISSNTKFQ